MKKEISTKVAEIVAKYTEKKELYNDLGKSVVLILENLVKKNQYYSPIIFSRAKNEKSLENKLLKECDSGKIYLEDKNIKTFSDVEDLAGVRIVFYLESEAKKFVHYIYKEFGDENIVHKSKVKEKGYNATHLIINLDKKRLKLSEYSRFKKLKCEIQITTVLDHAWSEVEHEIIYKPEDGIKNFDKKSFNTLKKSFEETYEKHIKKAKEDFEAFNHLYQELKKGNEIFDIEFLKKMTRENTNNEIYPQLELLEKYTSTFGDKIPGDFNIIQVLDNILKKTKNNKTVVEKTAFGNLPGKTYDDICMIILNIVNYLRYSRYPDSFDFLINIFHGSSEKIKIKIIEVVENIVKYNYGMVKEHGLFIQRDILNKIQNMDLSDKEKLFDIIKIACKEILKPSFNGLKQTGENTFSMEGGHINPNKNYKKLREDALKIVFEMFENTSDLKLKLQFLNILETASSFPINSAYGNDYEEMINENVNFIIDKYENIIFNKDNDITADLSVVQNTEKHLNWLIKRKIGDSKKIKNIIDAIKEDRLYSIYRLLIGEIFYYKDDDEGLEEAKERRNKEINKFFESLNDENFNNNYTILEKIAKNNKIIEDHKFSNFKQFLKALAIKKPELTDKILEKAFKDDSCLKRFVGNFLCGFREVNNTGLWDKYVRQIVKEKDLENFISIFYSFLCIPDKNIEGFIRKSDMEFLRQTINRDEKFKNYKDEIFNNLQLNYSLIKPVLKVFNYHKEEAESMIVLLFENTIKKEYFQSYLHEIEFSIKSGILKLSLFSNSLIDLLLKALTDIDSLDYHAQEILYEIGKTNYKKMIDIFVERIKLGTKKGKKRKTILTDRYESIPYHFNPGLAKLIGENAEYKEIVVKWIKDSDLDDKIYIWELGRFIKRVYAPTDDILEGIIDESKDTEILKIVDMFELTSGPNMDLLFKIIEKTDNEVVRGKVLVSMYKTGVVSGEYGLVEAYRNKIKTIETYREKYSGNKDVLEFINKTIEDLKTNVISEKKRADEEIKIRKLKYRSHL